MEKDRKPGQNGKDGHRRPSSNTQDVDQLRDELWRTKSDERKDEIERILEGLKDDLE